MPIFSILYPTRRSKIASTVCDDWFNKATSSKDVECLMGIDYSNRTSVNDFIPQAIQDKDVKIVITNSDCSVACNNQLAKLAKGNLLIMAQDDVIPSTGWDKELLDNLPEGWEDMELVLNIAYDPTNRLGGNHILAHIAVTRKRYERLGYYLNPCFKHSHSDDFHTYRARFDSVELDLRDKILWEHRRFNNGDEVEYHRSSCKEWWDIGVKELSRLMELYKRTGKDI